MPGETFSRDEKPLLTIAAGLPGFSTIGVFLEEGRNNVDVLVDLLMVLLLTLLRLLVLVSHVVTLALASCVDGAKAERRERRRVSGLTVLLTASEAERNSVGILLITHFACWVDCYRGR